MWPFGKRGGTKGPKLKIFFASDLHGSTVCFKKFINAAAFYGADVLLLGGDLTGKAVLPICKQTDGRYLAHQSGDTVRLDGRGEVGAFERRAANMGLYPVQMEEDEFQNLLSNREEQQKLFKRLVRERVEQWSEHAEAKLKGTGIPLVTAPGNDDFFEVDDILNGSHYIDYHDRQVTELKGYQVLHVGGSNRTPWDTEREYPEEEFEQRFEQLAADVEDMRRCIFNVHVPPHGTALDRCPKLDENLQVVYEMGNPVQIHAGSVALLNAINAHQPLLGLHGHIHEGRGRVDIGQSVCVNPGSVFSEGILQGVMVTLQADEVTAVQLTQG